MSLYRISARKLAEAQVSRYSVNSLFRVPFRAFATLPLPTCHHYYYYPPPRSSFQSSITVKCVVAFVITIFFLSLPRLPYPTPASSRSHTHTHTHNSANSTRHEQKKKKNFSHVLAIKKLYSLFYCFCCCCCWPLISVRVC